MNKYALLCAGMKVCITVNIYIYQYHTKHFAISNTVLQLKSTALNKDFDAVFKIFLDLANTYLHVNMGSYICIIILYYFSLHF